MKVSVKPLATVTEGFANDVDDDLGIFKLLHPLVNSKLDLILNQ